MSFTKVSSGKKINFSMIEYILLFRQEVLKVEDSSDFLSNLGYYALLMPGNIALQKDEYENLKQKNLHKIFEFSPVEYSLYYDKMNVGCDFGLNVNNILSYEIAPYPTHDKFANVIHVRMIGDTYFLVPMEKYEELEKLLSVNGLINDFIS